MAELIDVANAMFRNRNDWSSISEDDKEKFFFIFNRYFSKKYLQQSYLLNLKSTNKSESMDIWFHFMKDKPYPQWFWSKSDSKQKSELNEKDYKLLIMRLNVKDSDLDYLIDKFPYFIKEELKYYKQLDKQ
jgi:hypothetical protein